MVESINYSDSFDTEVEQEWDWSERDVPQPEILQDANHVIDRFDLKRHVPFSTRITGATYDDSSQHWSITIDRGDYVAAGTSSRPSEVFRRQSPEIAGVDTFEGNWYHTGHLAARRRGFHEAGSRWNGDRIARSSRSRASPSSRRT
jgi:cyclohexanone monooxygenase